MKRKDLSRVTLVGCLLDIVSNQLITIIIRKALQCSKYLLVDAKKKKKREKEKKKKQFIGPTDLCN